MASYFVPNQNLTIDIPDEGVYKASTSTGWNSGQLLFRQGNTLFAKTLEQLGEEYARQAGINVPADRPGKEQLGEQFLSSKGINYGSLPNYAGNAEAATVFQTVPGLKFVAGNQLPLTTVTSLLATPQKTGANYTQTQNAGNPFSQNTVSSTQGTIFSSEGDPQPGALTPDLSTYRNPNNQLNPQPATQGAGNSDIQALLTNPSIATSGGYGRTQNGSIVDLKTGKVVAQATQQTLNQGSPNQASPSGPGSASEDISNLPPEFQALYTQLDTYLKELQKKGQVLNPNIEITPAKVAEFTAQAEREINPYFSGQLKLSRESLLSSLGYSADEIVRNEQALEKKYGQQVRDIASSAAEQGLAQSGLRARQEQELASDFGEQIGQTRRKFAETAAGAARTFAQQYGGRDLPSFQIAGAPTVGAGELKFDRPQGPSNLYQLSPDLYDNLVGEQEFARRGAVSQRSSQLEEAFRGLQGVQQQRQLTI